MGLPEGLGENIYMSLIVMLDQILLRHSGEIKDNSSDNTLSPKLHYQAVG